MPELGKFGYCIEEEEEEEKRQPSGNAFVDPNEVHDTRQDHFLPLFLMPPPVKGPFPEALAFISASFLASSFCFCLKAISSSSISLFSFLGAFKGFFLPPSRPDIVTVVGLT